MLERVTTIAGGIGSGKSVISSILRAKGYYVYDSDSEAKRLMDNDNIIKLRIKDEICEKAINPDGSINRKVLAREVFSDNKKLISLNSIVHSRVLEDIRTRIHSVLSGKNPGIRKKDRFFVESAISFTSGISEMSERIWVVETPLEIRIARVINRDRCDRQSALNRMESQENERVMIEKAKRDKDNRLTVIDNCSLPYAPLLPQINDALRDHR